MLFAATAAIGFFCVISTFAAQTNADAGAIAIAEKTIKIEPAFIPPFFVRGETQNIGFNLKNNSTSEISVDCVFELPPAVRESQKKVLPPNSETLLAFPLTIPATAELPGAVVLRIQADEDTASTDEEIAALSISFRVNTASMLDVRVEDGAFMTADDVLLVLVDAPVQPAQARRWRPLRWINQWLPTLGRPVFFYGAERIFDFASAGIAKNGGKNLVHLAYDGDPMSACIEVPREIPTDIPAVAVVAWGLDECRERYDERIFERALNTMVERMKQWNPALRIFILNPPPVPGREKSSFRYAAIIRRVAHEQQLRIIDCHANIAENKQWRRKYLRNGDERILTELPAVWSPETADFAEAPKPEPEQRRNGENAEAPQNRETAVDNVIIKDINAIKTVVFPGKAQFVKLLGDDGVAGLPGIVEIDLRIPTDAPADMWLAAYAKDKDGVWFQTTAQNTLSPGERQTTLVFDFSGNAAQVQAAGHSAVWNEYWAGHMNEVGLQLFSAAHWMGEVAVDNVRLRPTFMAAKPAIQAFRCLTQEPQAYQMLEFEFDISGNIGNPFNPEDVRIDCVFTTPAGDVKRVPTFYYQRYERYLDEAQAEQVKPGGVGVWRVRMTPFASGIFTWRFEGEVHGERLETRDHALEVAPGVPQGFIRTSTKDHRFFEDAAGDFFYGIGHNIRSPTDVRSARKLKLELPPDQGTFAYDRLFEKMAAHGENVGMVWMCNWWLSIEWNENWRGFQGINDYNLGNAWRLDRLLEAAARHGIFIYLDIDNHGKYSTYCDPEWQTSPFNQKNGGPCSSPIEMFGRDDMFELYRRRVRYITARWGAYHNLLGWNLISEINLTGVSGGADRHSPELFAWVKKAADAFHELDVHKHPVGTQWSGDWRTIYPKMAALPELDIVVGDSYKGGNASIVDLLLETAVNLSKYEKPYFTAEFGGSAGAASFPRLRADLHAGLWSNAMTTNAMAPMFWWFDYIDRKNRYVEFKALADFLDGWDPRGKKMRTTHTDVLMTNDQAQQPVRAVVMYMDDTAAQGWVYDKKCALEWPAQEHEPLYADVKIKLDGLADGEYEMQFWDTQTGAPLNSVPLKVENNETTATIPQFKTDIAFKLQMRSQ